MIQPGSIDEPRDNPGPAAERDLSSRGELTLLQLVNLVLRHRRLMFGVPIVLVLLVLAVTLVLPQTYSATASFTPQAEGPQSRRLSGLAAEFGFDIPTGEASRSPQFYADLLRSDDLLRAAVIADYQVVDGPGDEALTDSSLVELYGFEAESEALQIDRTIRRLHDQLSVETDRETGVVAVTIKAQTADLAHQIVRKLLDLVNEFDTNTRQSRAAQERRFLEQRMESAKEELQAVEDSLQTFLEQNRQYQNSPALRFEHVRMERRVSLHQDLAASLSESYEQARIQEVRNTPIITVVDQPDRPPKPDSRGLLFRGVVAFVLGAFLALIWSGGKELLHGARHKELDRYEEFQRLWASTREELRGWWLRLRNPTASGSGR